MSAIGSGITIISGSKLDASIPTVLAAGEVLTFSHFVGKKAWQIICSDAQGNIVTDLTATQTLNAPGIADTIALTAGTSGSYFISIRWQENSAETSMIPVDSASVVITPAPGPGPF
jgi:hypothetical protein